MFGMKAKRVEVGEKVAELAQRLSTTVKTLTGAIATLRDDTADAMDNLREDLASTEGRVDSLSKELAEEEICRRERMAEIECRIEATNSQIDELRGDVAAMVLVFKDFLKSYEESNKGQQTINRLLVEDWVNGKMRLEEGKKAEFKDIDLPRKPGEVEAAVSTGTITLKTNNNRPLDLQILSYIQSAGGKGVIKQEVVDNVGWNGPERFHSPQAVKRSITEMLRKKEITETRLLAKGDMAVFLTLLAKGRRRLCK